MKILIRHLTVLSVASVVLALTFGLQSFSSTTAYAAKDDSPFISTSTAEGRLAVFDDVWETIQERYYDIKFNGIDWQASRIKFRALAGQAKSTHEFYDVIRKMLSALKDAHTRAYGPDEKFDWWNPRFITLGFTIREVEGLPTVIQVNRTSEAARNGIRPGDVLLKIDNVPAKQFITQKLEAPGLASDTSARYRAIANVLEGPAGSTVQIDWQTKGGKTKSASFTRFWNQKQLGFGSQRSDNIAIIKIDAFTQSLALEFTKALPKMVAGADGIILDLRGNGGGDAEAMADVVSPFLADGTGLGKFVDRSGASFELHSYLKRLWPSAAAVNLPIVVLTSESTSSAAEIMTAALQTNRNAQVIGTGSCGCVLAIRSRHELPDGGVLDVSEFDYRTTAGVRLEGRGIIPDTRTSLKRQDLYAGRDRTLEIAKSYLKRSMEN
ncbi:MAG TPA: S41 family peptidase [Pyrinomonadaceae bacterium]|jgi:Periplasmic protease|nr:S41 family peptidase [Pyrinomonadaceae bacterium]